MAPFPIIEAQPQIAPREASPDQITLSVTHESTTYTTTVALGPSTVVTSDAAAATTFLTTAVASAPTQTAQVTLPRDSSSGSSNTGVVIGAVLGSVLGTFVLITVLYKCCFDNRSALWIPSISRFYDSDSDSDSERSSRSSRRVHRRGGGGEGFGRDNRRGDRVRRPRRARTRRSRREESGSRSSRSYSTRYGRRKSSGMNNNDGLLGWFLVPRTTPYGYRYTERKHTRSSWAGGGGLRSTADD